MRRGRRVLLGALALLLLSALANFCLGASGVSPADIVRALAGGERESVAARVFLYVRLPRALAAVVAAARWRRRGCCCSRCCANPLASPSVLGINAGAGLCALVVMAFFPAAAGAVPGAAFAGACLSAFAVYALPALDRASRTTVVLAGVAVNSLMSACMDRHRHAGAGRGGQPLGVLHRRLFAVTMPQLGFAAPFWALGLLRRWRFAARWN